MEFTFTLNYIIVAMRGITPDIIAWDTVQSPITVSHQTGRKEKTGIPSII